MSKRSKKIPPRPAYVQKLKSLYAIGAIPRDGVARVGVFHDADCALLTYGGMCNCQPDVKVRWSQAAAAQN